MSYKPLIPTWITNLLAIGIIVTSILNIWIRLECNQLRKENAMLVREYLRLCEQRDALIKLQKHVEETHARTKEM